LRNMSYEKFWGIPVFSKVWKHILCLKIRVLWKQLWVVLCTTLEGSTSELSAQLGVYHLRKPDFSVLSN
jgi:hypothetical protein